MEKKPEGYIVYWTSMFAGTKKGWTTPKFKANMKTIKTEESAIALCNTLHDAKDNGTPYMYRSVFHVGGYFKLGEKHGV